MSLLSKGKALMGGNEEKRQSFGRWREEKAAETDAQLKRISGKEKRRISPPAIDGDFSEIEKKEEQQRQDKIIWKTYSKRGGIYDKLEEIKQFIDHPSINAFDFDEEEGCYMVFITINNTLLGRVKRLCDDMREQLECGHKTECRGLPEEMKLLEKKFRELEGQKKAISGKENTESFREERREILRIMQKSSWEVLLKGQETGRQKVEQALADFSKRMDRYERKLDKLNENVEAYEHQLEDFKDECEFQKSYAPKYMALYELLGELRESVNAGGEYHILTISPSGKEELDRYMNTAEKFGMYVLKIIEKYPL